MKWFVRSVIRYRVIMLTLMLFITVSSLAVLSTANISTNIEELFFGDNPEFQAYAERNAEFGNDMVFIVAYEDDDLLSKESLARLKKIVSEIEKFQMVKAAHSLLDVPDIKVEDGMLEIDGYVDQVLADPEKAPEILEKLKSDPLVGGLIVSKDGKASLVVVEFKTSQESDVEDAENVVPMLGKILQVFSDNGFDESKIHRAGMSANMGESLNQINTNIKLIFPIVCVVLLTSIWIMFRRFWPVLITGTVTLLAVLWTMGFAVLVFGDINIFMSLVPGVVVIISFSDVVHLCSSYLLELSHGEQKDNAILLSCSEVGKACLYTSLTTFFGFISLSLVPAPAFQQMGLVMGFGVAIALLLAMTLCPILFSIMRQPKPWRMDDPNKVHGMLDSILDFMEYITTHRPWIVVGTFLALIVISSIGISRIKIETDFVKRLSKDNKLRKDAKYFSENFAGANMLEVYIDAPRKGELLEPETFQKIAELQDRIETIETPKVGAAMSIIDLIRAVHAQFNPEAAKKKPLPGAKKQLAQYLFLFEMSDSGDLDRLIDFDRQTMHMTVRLDDNGVMANYQLGEKIETLAKEVLPSELDVHVTGLVYLMGSWLDNIIAGQRRGLVFAALTIMVMMIIAFRSYSAGMWSMVPNLIPIIAVGGYVGWFWDQVDSDIMMIAVIAIGIGVDDTIHFLMRLHIELDKKKDIKEALDCTFHYSGRAIIITSIILVLGFAPFAISDYFTTHMIGTLLPGCLLVALLADLALVPALVKLGLFRFRF